MGELYELYKTFHKLAEFDSDKDLWEQLISTCGF